MFNWKHKLFASALAVAVAVPGAVYAAEATEAEGAAGLGIQPVEVHILHKDHHKVRVHMPFGPHREMYMTLLAEKYTPEDVDEWKATFAERERILNELKALRPKGEGSDEAKAPLRQWKEAKKGEPARDGLLDRLKEWRKEQAGEPGSEQSKEWENFVQAHRELHEAFTKAVDAQDAEAIKEVLPKLLEEAKQINEHLAKKLEEAKKKLADSSADSGQ